MESPMLSPKGRVVMISGASRGIGRAVAEHLLELGYRLSLGVRDPKSLAGLAKGRSARALVQRYDAADRLAGKRWVRATVERFGRLDGLVNNAGIFRMVDPENGAEADLDALWEINVKGPFRLIQAAFPHLKAAGSGRIVNIASLSGKRVKAARSGGYAMSKFALVALTQAVRFSGWPHGIRASAVCPGFVATDMARPLAGVPDSAMTQPGDVARLVALLLALPNTAAVPEILVNQELEPGF
jgi:NAD(P)-dependent dehydrogenase (short-subunit alcohol dehydrogenase family)